MGRDTVLGHVRAALEGVTPSVLPPLAARPCDQAPQAPQDLTARFVSEARAVGTAVHVVGTRAEAAEAVAAIARTAPAARLLVTWPTALARSVVAEAGAALPDLEVTVLGADTPPDAIASADIGVTEADALIAESGTLVLRSSGRYRGASLLPPVHVAVVTADRLVPDLAAALRLVRAGAAPAESCVTLITGPSRTADIEKKLVVGVHGPCVLHVILVRDGMGEARELSSRADAQREAKPSGGEQ
jgi:L-lactate dehydrogenase complex protein LldG